MVLSQMGAPAPHLSATWILPQLDDTGSGECPRRQGDTRRRTRHSGTASGGAGTGEARAARCFCAPLPECSTPPSADSPRNKPRTVPAGPRTSRALTAEPRSTPGEGATSADPPGAPLPEPGPQSPCPGACSGPTALVLDQAQPRAPGAVQQQTALLRGGR